ncbi:MAG: helix-turn-helix domain-containing protein [Plectolyngbya sp. WJT66-NPBG17]|jgi:transposase|nr:helix-turn-helix domain-containing protein [Plectolyngbya sp. WJT66-NPBG17]MBW4527945.1 helix-turn-helix domain-containing protein [Phormidium tanganyikae FI6-MK23]
MKNPDARLLNPAAQNYLRPQAIRLRQQGKRVIDIAAYLGVHRNTITDWGKDDQTRGEAGLEQQQRIPTSARQPRLRTAWRNSIVPNSSKQGSWLPCPS